MAASTVCVSCLDGDEEVVFRCKGDGGVCAYQLCATCVKIAFDDKSGSSSSFCAMCKSPTAIDMIASVCGQGALLAVEKKIRGEVEFKLKEENIRKDASRSKAQDLNEQARELFNDLAEKINLRCPRCKAAFYDYDGCNALKCGVPECRAGFCAICLKDCGHDAHAHIYAGHQGQIFDKQSFERAKSARTQTQIIALMDKISHEPFELQQLVKNHIEKAKLTPQSLTKKQAKKAVFLSTARADLARATRCDRLALLSNPDTYDRNTLLSKKDISPRCAVPSDYRLSLNRKQGDLYSISLEHRIIEGGRWKQVNDIEKHFKENPKVESLSNITQALRCAVVAFEGRPLLYQSSRGNVKTIPNDHRFNEREICIQLRSIDRDGRVSGDAYELHGELTIAGLNQNTRMILLEEHVAAASDSELMFEPLQHLVGSSEPVPVVTEMNMEVPHTQVELNEEQRLVAHPLRLKTAMEVAGPPGTGKTKTIVELVRALLHCTSYDILLLSERNGAINAVAEKFQQDSLDLSGCSGCSPSISGCSHLSGCSPSIKDLYVWSSLMTYGVGDSMGESTKLFTKDAKIQYHPELIDLRKKRELLMKASKSLSKDLRGKIAEAVRSFGSNFNEAHAFNRSEDIQKNTVELTSPLSVINSVRTVVEDIAVLLDDTKNHGSKYVQEDDTSCLIVKHSALLGRLVPIRPDNERDDKNWNAKEATRRLRFILEHFTKILCTDLFSEDNARALYKEKTLSDDAYNDLLDRLSIELPKLARLHMCTIGSSHRLPAGNDETGDGLADRLQQLFISDSDGETDTKPPMDTIVIFDESGCIPSYELLGLSRLGRAIRSLVLVGDKKQLPPYNPTQGRRSRKNSRLSEQLKSLLDSSVLTVDSGKVTLTKQYRVPKDIADMLNHRVYGGQYNTCPLASVPLSGLHMVNVPWSESQFRKYVNPNEVERGISMLEKLMLDYDISSTLVITPYKNQQREFEFQLRNYKHITTTVLTIDQCQGQEADAIIFSLVRKPTRFLTLNRLNVALSRVRKKLYVLTDFQDLRSACRDEDWDCARLAADLLIDFI